MRRDARAYLTDAHDAAALIRQFVQGRTLENYRADPMLCSAVERQFEIIGEAFNQLAKTAPTLAERIPVVVVIFQTRLDAQGQYVPNNFVVTGWATYIWSQR